MGDIKTPRHAKGSRALRFIEKTSQSVFAAKLPTRTLRHAHHSHALVGARHILRIDRQPWEERVADILRILEHHRFDRNNALHNAINNAEQAMNEANQKKAEVESFAEELKAANEEMRANNEEMRAANEEMRAVSEELERRHTDVEHIMPRLQDGLQQPLADMGAFMRKLLKDFKSVLDAPAGKQLAQAAAQAEDMAGLINALTRYWQVDLESQNLEPADCETVLAQASANLKAVVKASKASITHDPLPQVAADADQLRRVFEALIANAVIFRGPKRPQIHISALPLEQIDAPPAQIAFSAGWVFAVEDNGAGIAPDDADEIFHCFQGTADAQGQTGAGMGLAVAWRIVKRHGGHIWVESASGKGSIFRFALPEYKEDESA